MGREKYRWIDQVQSSMEVLGFWTEGYRSQMIKSIERSYADHILKEWCISDVVMNGDKVLLKWEKRLTPLSAAKIKEQYRR